jgi:hypothetical protein
MATIGLRQIVAQFLDSADQSSHQFRRMFNIGVRGSRAFNLDITGTMVTVLLPVNINNTVNLPVDYLTYSKMGIINERGEIITFTKNEQLSQYHAIYQNQENRNEDVPELTTIGNYVAPLPYPYLYSNYWSGGTYYTLFGLNSGTAQICDFDIDEGAGVILLNPKNTYEEILFEYLSDGYDETADDYQINSMAEEAFMCYLRWKSATDMVKKFSAGQVREYKNEYYREMRLAKMRINKAYASEFTARKRSLTGLTAKA